MMVHILQPNNACICCFFPISQVAAGSVAIKGETVAKLKVAINGFGRIGRNFLRCWHGRKDSPLEVIVVNDSGGVKNVRLQKQNYYLRLIYWTRLM